MMLVLRNHVSTVLRNHVGTYTLINKLLIFCKHLNVTYLFNDRFVAKPLKILAVHT